jgi:hypothetical protein
MPACIVRRKLDATSIARRRRREVRESLHVATLEVGRTQVRIELERGREVSVGPRAGRSKTLATLR